MKTRLIFLLATVAFLSSCEEVVDIENDPSKTQLVVNAVPQAGKRAFVYFAGSRFFLDPSNDQPLDAASVTLYVNGTPYTPDSVAHCKYFFPYTYVEGDSLRLDARAGDRQAKAQTYVPYIPSFTKVKIYDRSAGGTMHWYRAQIDFQDHAGIDEYYNLCVMVRDSGVRFNEWQQKYDTVDTVHVNYFLLRNCSEIQGDASYTNPMMGVVYTRNYFNDSKIDGQNYHMEMDLLHLLDTNEVEPFKHEYTISLESITYARLRYLIDVARQGGGSTSFFTEQGNVRGNVEGALGIFAGSAKSEVTFWPDTLPPFPTGAALPSSTIPAQLLNDISTMPHR